MRRLVALFLLLLLPLQFAFAAAAPYCAMEKVETPTHFGHHDHVADAALAQDEGKNDSSVSGDCGICHLASAQTAPSDASANPEAHAALVKALPDLRRPQHVQEPSERPPRSTLA